MNLYYILRLIDADVTKDYEYYLKTYCEGKEILDPANGKNGLLFLKEIMMQNLI